MSVLEVQQLVKAFGDVRAVDDVSFSVDEGEILVVVGGSGCGKTTTLRCIAGLEDVSDGVIRLDGRVIASKTISVAPERRGIGMVFQSYALWPHKTVFQNVSYGLERKGAKEAAIREAVERALKQVGLSAFAQRYPSTLSGGQQQRVALARSAVLEPRLLLLDEPLSNLDAKLREQMRDELKDMIKLLRMTAVHITHDQAEAMALADRLVCMREGRVEQIGSPRELYAQPKTRFVADFIGDCSFLDGRIVEATPEAPYVEVEVSPGLRLRARRPPVANVASATVALRPEAVTLLSESDDAADSVACRVLKAVYLGPYTQYCLDLGGFSLKAHSRLAFAPGATCRARIDPAQAACLASER